MQAENAPRDTAEQSEERLLYQLKSRGALSASELAETLEMTPTGARQHLARLLDRGLVSFEDERQSVGRPKRRWRLSSRGHARFPDRHGVLTVELLAATREVFGEAGMLQLISHREQHSLQHYQEALVGVDGWRQRVRRLAELRDAEGYMAEAREEGNAMLLIENHCPICAAARECQGLCRSELEQFQSVLGDDLAVSRSEHLLSGARRCTYLIQPKT